MPVGNIVGNSTYTEYDKISESLKNFKNCTALKVGVNGLEADTRVKPFVSIGSWKSNNHAIEQSTRDLAAKLKNVLIDKFGKQNGMILFNKYINKEHVEGKKQITALDVKVLFAHAKKFETAKNPEFDEKMNEILKECNIEPQLVRHVLDRVAISLDVPSHNYQDLLVNSEDLKKSIRAMVNLRSKVKNSGVLFEQQGKKDELLGILDENIARLQEKQKDIDNEVANYPFIKNTVRAATDDVIAAGKSVLGKLQKEFSTNKATQTKLKACERYLQTVKNDLYSKYPDKYAFMQFEDEIFLETFGRVFAKKLAQATGKNEKNLRKEFKKAYFAALPGEIDDVESEIIQDIII